MTGGDVDVGASVVVAEVVVGDVVVGDVDVAASVLDAADVLATSVVATVVVVGVVVVAAVVVDAVVGAVVVSGVIVVVPNCDADGVVGPVLVGASTVDPDFAGGVDRGALGLAVRTLLEATTRAVCEVVTVDSDVALVSGSSLSEVDGSVEASPALVEGDAVVAGASKFTPPEDVTESAVTKRNPRNSAATTTTHPSNAPARDITSGTFPVAMSSNVPHQEMSAARWRVAPARIGGSRSAARKWRGDGAADQLLASA